MFVRPFTRDVKGPSAAAPTSAVRGRRTRRGRAAVVQALVRHGVLSEGAPAIDFPDFVRRQSAIPDSHVVDDAVEHPPGIESIPADFDLLRKIVDCPGFGSRVLKNPVDVKRHLRPVVCAGEVLPRARRDNGGRRAIR